MTVNFEKLMTTTNSMDKQIELLCVMQILEDTRDFYSIPFLFLNASQLLLSCCYYYLLMKK